MEELIQLDKQLFQYLNSLGSTTWDGFWMFITGKWNSIPLYVVLVYLLYKKTSLKATVIAVLIIALMITFTDQLANVFKDGFMRLRPCYDIGFYEAMRRVKPSCGGKYGYFSAHAASSMALAIFLGKVFKPYFKYAATILVTWAIVVGYSRIYIGVHFPGDVLTGMFFGVLIALILYKLYELLLNKIQFK